jgi:hypothetical protein
MEADAIQSIDFDVRVGKGIDAPPDLPENIQRMTYDLSRRRIDVVAIYPRRIIVAEVTRTAGLTALGQLKAYPLLYVQTYNPGLPVKPLLICESFAPDMIGVFKAEGIDFFLSPPPQNT